MKNSFFSTFFKSKTNILGLLIAFVGAYVLFPSYLELNVMPLSLSKELWMSLDPSWVIALNYVKLKGMTWGTDIAFTYGPLAHLLTRAGWGENKLTFLVFDLFIACNYFLLFFISFQKSGSKLLTVFIILSICLLFPIWLGSANAMVLMAFLVFWIRMSIEKPKWFYYVFQIGIITLLFFTKFNTGLIAFPLFLSGITYNILSKNGNRIALLSYAIVPIVLIVALCFPFKVDLLAYVTSGFEIVSGYNDVMYLKNQLEYSYSIALFIIVILTAIIFINNYSNKKESWLKTAVLLFLFGTSVFVLYKQAFVRGDVGHLKDFFVFIPLIILCNVDLYANFKNKYIKLLFLVPLVLTLYFIYIRCDKENDLKDKFRKTDYITAYKAFTTTSGMHLYQNNFPLPASVLQKVGTSTVDVFPWNIQLLIENKLNYLPRPTIQSYNAYTPYLEKLNFEHYNSSKAPEFVIYDYASIDDRYPLFDESRVNVALAYNYQLAEVFEYDGRKILLLQKKKEFKKVTFTMTKEYAMYLNAPLVPKEGVYYEVYFYNSLKGKAVSVLEHAPEIGMEILASDGTITYFKTSKLLLELGVFSSQFITQTSDFMNMIQPNESVKNRQIKAYYFKPVHGNSFNDKMKIIEYKIN